jgi:hypothetical protein
MSIDSYRFLDFASRQVMKAWAGRQERGVIPFTPLAVNLYSGRIPHETSAA